MKPQGIGRAGSTQGTGRGRVGENRGPPVHTPCILGCSYIAPPAKHPPGFIADDGAVELFETPRARHCMRFRDAMQYINGHFRVAEKMKER